MVASAIAQVFCDVENGNLPCEWDKNDGIGLHLVEQVFQMPDPGSAMGSVAWLQKQKNNPSKIPFRYAVQFPELMTSLVRYLIKKGTQQGFPKVKPGEEVCQSEAYQPDSKRTRTKGSQKAHKHLPFLCVSSVNKAIRELKNLGLYPIRVMAEHMPSGKDWHNFAEVLHTFYVLYCQHQGLVKTSALARRVHLYIFYAAFDGPRGKKWPVIRYVHRMVTNGRHRFAATSTKHFDELFALLDRQPDLVSKLNDKGVAGVPPEYTAAVENGLRSHGEDLHAMGTNAM